MRCSSDKGLTAREKKSRTFIDQVLAIGDEVRLKITGPCPQCIMTTLAQSDMPADSRILRRAARHNKAHVGVYASVLQEGLIRRGDATRLPEWLCAGWKAARGQGHSTRLVWQDRCGWRFFVRRLGSDVYMSLLVHQPNTRRIQGRPSLLIYTTQFLSRYLASLSSRLLSI